MGDSAYDFLGMIIDSVGGSASDRMAFKVYAFQRLHAANFHGVAVVMSSTRGRRFARGLVSLLGAACCHWVLPAQSRSSTLEAMAASRALQLPQPQIANFAAARLTSST